MTDYHLRFLALVDEIERTYPVTDWRVGDIPVWPLARIWLYQDLYWQDNATGPVDGRAARQPRVSVRVLHALSQAATPITNIWKGRNNIRHLLVRPRPAHALFFDDGVSLDRIDGVWRDPLLEPLMAELHQDGRSMLLMQRGNLIRLPRTAPVLAANTIENWGELLAAGLRQANRLAGVFPKHELVARFLERNGVPAHTVGPSFLRKRAAQVSAIARGFERVLEVVRPSICFIVTSASGHALTLACRRRGVLSVELQRSGLGARHERSCWSAIPENGYPLLPAVFWTWTENDAAAIEGWTTRMQLPWHRSICGGHPQLSAWFDDLDPQTQAFDAKIEDLRSAHPGKLDILVALQNHGNYIELWNELAALIERAPSDWRWWLRRHPFAGSDKELGRLLTVRRPNVLIQEASSFPLPALLRHMDAFVSLRSGAAVEASMFGLKPIFLSPVARELFPNLFEAGGAEIIADITALEERLRNPLRRTKTRTSQPDLRGVLARLDSAAAEYSALCARSGLA